MKKIPLYLIYSRLVFSAAILLLSVLQNAFYKNWMVALVVVGLLTRIEILLILFILKHWHNDVPSVYHAVLIRKGRDIKRHKLFNG